MVQFNFLEYILSILVIYSDATSRARAQVIVANDDFVLATDRSGQLFGITDLAGKYFASNIINSKRPITPLFL